MTNLDIRAMDSIIQLSMHQGMLHVARTIYRHWRLSSVLSREPTSTTIAPLDSCEGYLFEFPGTTENILKAREVDTYGAGDAYASGFLYGILRGVSDLKGMGMLASRVAAVVSGQQGTRLRVQDAGKLARSFADHVESSEVCSDVGSDQISSV
ncbi:hypothetical protein ACLOJK_002577 [Asimina triloba]